MVITAYHSDVKLMSASFEILTLPVNIIKNARERFNQIEINSRRAVYYGRILINDPLFLRDL